MINIEGFTPAEKHGVPVKKGTAQIFVDKFSKLCLSEIY